MRTLTPRKAKRSKRLPLIDTLEPRTLMSATSLVVPDYLPLGFESYASDGSLWVGTLDGNGSNVLSKIVADPATPGAGLIADTINIDSVAFFTAAPGLNGDIWLTDFNGGLTEVNTLTHALTPFYFATSPGAVATHVSVDSTGIVWFTTVDNQVGRLDPSTYNSLDGSFAAPLMTQIVTGGVDNQGYSLSAIAAQGAGSAWVAVNPDVGVDVRQVASVSFDGTALSNTEYAISESNSVANASAADANNHVNSIVSDGSGGVWFTLANTDGLAEDRIVHGVLSGGNLVQTGYIVSGATAASPLNIGALTLDSHHRLWYAEFGGTNVNYFDTTTSTFATPTNLGVSPFDVLANPTADQVSVITIDGAFPIFQVTADPVVTDVPLNLTSFDVTRLAARVVVASGSFTDDAGLPVSTFSVSISWNDGTTSKGVVLRDPRQAGRYLILGVHAYKRSGTYTVTVNVSTTEPGAVLGVTSLSDTITV